MVNMWAIAHDPELWPEPDEFRPERFAEEDVSVLGGDLRLAPFGAGRRACPGKTLAARHRPPLARAAAAPLRMGTVRRRRPLVGAPEHVAGNGEASRVQG
ncbi:hypothetical protein OsJ_11275 [Oryza sativa Japonica Group]|uniref:Uncharacterized protein n=1 Tax=Oryza sativa subsp. japonica TaxID=39947 RepID=B9F911_ORYSJ|nr:hypothetical protein OsJ_11275 [Oryza sativa Japonica Group]